VENVESRSSQHFFNIENVEEMWKKQSMLGTVISMMTEKEFWDTFNKKHNPEYYYAKNKEKEKEQKKNKKQKNYTFKYKIFRKQD
jgi:hypothetical protein|tara:strand:- start:55 stop:309 length:255 start_codon:yes stop_codon:yes gene_type:complete